MKAKYKASVFFIKLAYSIDEVRNNKKAFYWNALSKKFGDIEKATAYEDFNSMVQHYEGLKKNYESKQSCHVTIMSISIVGK